MINVIGFFKKTSSHDKEFNVSSFNDKYELYAGKVSGFFLTFNLDNAVTDNKTTKHQITINY